MIACDETAVDSRRLGNQSKPFLFVSNIAKSHSLIKPQRDHEATIGATRVSFRT